MVPSSLSISSIPFSNNESLIASALLKSLFSLRIFLSFISFSISANSISLISVCLFHSDGFLLNTPKINKSKKILKRLKDKGVIQEDKSNHFYLYRITHNNKKLNFVSIKIVLNQTKNIKKYSYFIKSKKNE